MYIKKTTASLYTYRPLIRVAVVGMTHPTYSYSFHLRHNIYLYVYPTSGNHLRHLPTEPNRGNITKLPNCRCVVFASSFKALEISKPTKGIALVQVSAKAIRCDFSVFLVGKPMIKWSNRKVGGGICFFLFWPLIGRSVLEKSWRMCLACDPGGSFWGYIVHVAAHSRGQCVLHFTTRENK